MSIKIDNKANQESTILKACEEEPTAMKNTALAVRASLRSSTLSAAAIPAPIGKPESFRDIFCRSLKPESVLMALAPEPTATETKVASQAGHTPHAVTSIEVEPACRPRVVEKFDRPRLNVDKEEFEQDIAEYGLRTLKDSRWAETDLPILLHSNTHKIERKRNGAGYAGNALGNSHRTKGKAELPSHLPRLHMDVEEFERDVAKYGLKTLKDSRWAD